MKHVLGIEQQVGMEPSDLLWFEAELDKFWAFVKYLKLFGKSEISHHFHVLIKAIHVYLWTILILYLSKWNINYIIDARLP